MLYNAKNGTLTVDGVPMEYISFGKGNRNIIILQGLGDGLRTVKGLALPMAFMYKKFAKNAKVYAFSRKSKMPAGYTTKDMADDVAKAMDILGIQKADFIGVSQGGMIAQHLAADYPQRIGKLALVVTCDKANECVNASVSRWIKMAQQGDYSRLMQDNIISMYTHEYVRKYRLFLPIVGVVGRQKSFDRFLVMADACMTHDCSENVKKIQAQTLVIGGAKDTVVDCNASYTLNEKIKDSALYIYPQYGHALYDEAKDFNDRVYSFLFT